MTGDESIRQRVLQIVEEPDPERRLALSRRLRAEIWDLLSDEERDKVRKCGLGPADGSGPLRSVE